jgi:hypothetical protein
MRNKFAFLMIIAAGLLFTASCMKDKREYLPLGEVEMYMIEGLAQDARFLFLEFETKEEYNCLNYFIRFDNNSSSGNIDLHLRDVEKSDFCFTALGPAKAEVNLGIYQIGTYQTSIKVDEVENSGTLQVTNSQYILTLNNPQMIDVLFDTLNRVPMNFIWGYAAYNSTDNQPVVDAFMDTLQAVGATQVTLLPGKFGYFDIDGENNIHLIDMPEWDYSENFYYRFEESNEVLREIIRHFYLYHHAEIFVFLRTSTGQVFTSNLP